MEKSCSATGKTPLLQPMNQGVITTFKAYCLKQIFSKLIQETTGKEKPCLNDFWRQFNIMDGIDDTSITWEEVTIQCMSGLQQKQLPEFILNSVGFDVILALQKDIVSFAKEVGFERVDSKSVVELLASQSK